MIPARTLRIEGLLRLGDETTGMVTRLVLEDGSEVDVEELVDQLTGDPDGAGVVGDGARLVFVLELRAEGRAA